jgi:hypothetical protein
MRLCRYYGLNSGDPRGLWQRRLILSGATIDHLTHTFNTLKEVQGTIYCEFDDGSEVLVIFAYPNGRTERVAVSLRGCRFATNGRSSRWTTAHLQHRLLNLVKRR